MTTTYRKTAGTFFDGGSAAGGHEQAAPPVTVRQKSTQATTVGVHVRGNLRIETGGSGNGVSVMLDPVAMRRKMAIEQMQRDLRGVPSAKTTTNR